MCPVGMVFGETLKVKLKLKRKLEASTRGGFEANFLNAPNSKLSRVSRFQRSEKPIPSTH